MSAFLIVLPLESMAHGLFHELGNCLGGTCVGYAVVIPTNFCRYGYHAFQLHSVQMYCLLMEPMQCCCLDFSAIKYKFK